MTRLVLIVGIVWLSIFDASSAWSAETLDRLVLVESGDLPIILTAPHGGSESIPGVPDRKGVGVDLFSTRSDAFTDELAERTAAAIEQQTGKRPYTIIAQFHRKSLDANRPPRLAYESDEAKAVYDAYHHAIAQARRQVIQRWGGGLLLDLHGQREQPEVIFLGTQNGQTTEHLRREFGAAALTGEAGFFSQLTQQGFSIRPPLGSEEREHTAYDGGHTVITYGSGSGGPFDAIQLELGLALRSRDAIADTAEKLARVISVYRTKFLPTLESRSAARVGVYVDVGAGPSVNDLLTDLARFQNVSIRKLMADDIRSGALAELDLLIHPGGSGSKQGLHLGKDGRTAVRDFVEQGGGFIGICAGAYLASADYDWSLHLLDAKVVDRKHWNRGRGTVDLAVTPAGRRQLGVDVQTLPIHYAQGPLLSPANRPDLDDYQCLATFETEIALNGAPVGVMKGTTAIACGVYGRGRVFCFSPHPEMTDGLEALVLSAIEQVRREPMDQVAR